MPKSKQQESQTYQEMLDKVEALVEEIAAPNLELDSMVEKVETGYDLIKSMRTRLDETKDKVEKLREKYEDEF